MLWRCPEHAPGMKGLMEVAIFARVVCLRRWHLSRDLKAGERAGAVGGAAGLYGRAGAWRREGGEAGGPDP